MYISPIRMQRKVKLMYPPSGDTRCPVEEGTEGMEEEEVDSVAEVDSVEVIEAIEEGDPSVVVGGMVGGEGVTEPIKVRLIINLPFLRLLV
jgi:hypothetical protein